MNNTHTKSRGSGFKNPKAFAEFIYGWCLIDKSASDAEEGLRVGGEDAAGGLDPPLALEELVLHLAQRLEVDAVDGGGAGEGAEELDQHVVQHLPPRKFPCKNVSRQGYFPGCVN